MQIMCSRGCGEAIDVPQDIIDEANKVGAPLNVAHDPGQCPNEKAILPRYGFVITVRKYNYGPDVDDEGDDEGEILAMVGDTLEGQSLAAVMPALTKSINKQWERVQQMASIADQD